MTDHPVPDYEEKARLRRENEALKQRCAALEAQVTAGGNPAVLTRSDLNLLSRFNDSNTPVSIADSVSILRLIDRLATNGAAIAAQAGSKEGE
jgi:hypothetical protein